jgi:hypothetical protein
LGIRIIWWNYWKNSFYEGISMFYGKAFVLEKGKIIASNGTALEIEYKGKE